MQSAAFSVIRGIPDVSQKADLDISSIAKKGVDTDARLEYAQWCQEENDPRSSSTAFLQRPDRYEFSSRIHAVRRVR
jgi:post-segregation antitoxin (ccd killing protein)